MGIHLKWFSGLMIVTGINLAAWGQDSGKADPGNLALAARLEELAQKAVNTPKADAAALKWGESLLSAAARLNPDEPRFLRQLVEMRILLGDKKGAIESLKTYRTLQPYDGYAQILYIDLITSNMESSDARLAYLTDLAGKTQLAADVRSHAATLAAKLMLERMQSSKAEGMLQQAIILNPQSLEALRLKWQLKSGSATALERTAMMLAMLRSNPRQPELAESLGDELATAGCLEWSIQWYSFAKNMMQIQGQLIPPNLVVDLSAQLILANQTEAARTEIDGLLKVLPDHVDGWYLKALIEKEAGTKESYEKARKSAVNVLSNRLAQARQKLGIKGATTRPVDAGGANELPDLKGDVKLLKTAKAEVRSSYILAASDLAWFELYFNQAAGPARKLVDVLKQLQPVEDVTVARLEGWVLLLEGKKEASQVKLSAVSERDPLAAAGLLRVPSQDVGNKPISLRRKLVNENTSGLLGALLWDALKGPGVQRMPSASAQGINAELAKYPRAMTEILEQPKKFYLFRADVPGISFPFAQPIVAQVTILNISDYDLTLGRDGVIRWDVCFDAQWGGLMPKAFGKVAQDRIWQTTVLRAHSSIVQTVRLDQGELASAMADYPMYSLPIYASVISNPVQAKEAVIPGVGGYRTQFQRLIERKGYPIVSEQQRQHVVNGLKEGDAADKLTGMDILASYCRILRSGGRLENVPAGLEEEFTKAIRNLSEASNPTVAGWSMYRTALLNSPAEAEKTVSQMALAGDWQTRLLALVAARSLPDSRQKLIAGAMMKAEEDVIVKKCLKVFMELQAPEEATTRPGGPQRPTTRPATQPTPVPVVPTVKPELPTTRPVTPVIPVVTTRPAVPATLPATRPAAEPKTPVAVPTTKPATRPVDQSGSYNHSHREVRFGDIHPEWMAATRPAATMPATKPATMPATRPATTQGGPK